MALWRDIPGTQGRYACNRAGQIRRNAHTITGEFGGVRQVKTYTQRLLKPSPIKGHPAVQLAGLGTRLVRRVVADVWLGAAPVAGSVLRQKDGNPENCAVSNLVWAAPESRVNREKMQRGLAETAVRGIAKQYAARADTGESLAVIAARWGVSTSTVSNIGRGLTHATVTLAASGRQGGKTQAARY
jgi:hypothetical protein